MKIRIHPPLLSGISQALHQIFEEGFYADKVLERNFKANRKWGSRDRRAVAETVYEVVRNYLLLKTLLEKLDLPDSGDPYLHLAFLWIEAFQDIFEVSDSPLSGKAAEIRRRADELAPYERHSLPEWLDRELVLQRGEGDWAPLRQSLNQMAPVFLRANSLKGDARSVQKSLETEGFQIQRIDDLSLM
ncbi:MAG: hypothetical protein GW917_01545, partial [Bdellovibrionales bacterium]|nr:hypothetical protein [Bdellovibrionales bacterium]